MLINDSFTLKIVNEFVNILVNIVESRDGFSDFSLSYFQKQKLNNRQVEEQEFQKEETTTQSKDEKAIDLAKKEWGEDDDTVTFNVEEKNGSKYYVAVKKDATVISWYEVDTENWEINEY